MQSQQRNMTVQKNCNNRKNDRLGKKLMSTGNGRCNLTNHCISPDKYVGSFKSRVKKFLKDSAVMRWRIFLKLGSFKFYDNEGRYYPISKHAASVLDVLRLQVETLGIDVFTKHNVNSIKKFQTVLKFRLMTARKSTISYVTNL